MVEIIQNDKVMDGLKELKNVLHVTYQLDYE